MSNERLLTVAVKDVCEVKNSLMKDMRGFSALSILSGAEELKAAQKRYLKVKGIVDTLEGLRLFTEQELSSFKFDLKRIKEKILVLQRKSPL